MRPSIHFTPKQNWINDPNGLIYFNHKYHLFYQHNPLGNKWGNMSWGHATSADLLNWEELPVAINKEPEFAIFSGSAVHDEENQRLVAIYTAHREENQSQNLAFSYDGGITWEQYDENPVLNINYVDFRDPKVFRYQDDWIMSVVKPWEEKVSFYKSKNLIDWEFLSDFESDVKEEIQWECPDLVQFGQKWVLLISENKPGTIGRSKMRYYIGKFDGKEFIADDLELRPLDYGPDFYAGVTFNDAPENKKLMIGWMNNWGYAQKDKFAELNKWNGSMSVARNLVLKDKKLIQEFLAPTTTFKISAEITSFQLRYRNGDLKFYRGETYLTISRADLWSDELIESQIPISDTEHLNMTAVFDAGSIELGLNGYTYTARLNVGPETPELLV